MIVIIGGFPRSGTRSYADALNLMPGVDIRGEVHRAALPPLSNWLQLNDSAHKELGLKNEYVKHRWLTGLNAIVGTGRGGNSPFSMSNMINDVVGFKCPTIEIRLKNLERVFKPQFNPFDGKRIPFFFCSRRLDQVYLSRSNMTSKKRGEALSIDAFIKESIEQLKSLEVMEGSQVFEPHILNLDEFSSSKSKLVWFQNNVVNNVGLRAGSSEFVNEDMFVNNNSTFNVFGGRREEVLDEKLKENILKSDLINYCENFFEKYSHDLLPFLSDEG